MWIGFAAQKRTNARKVGHIANIKISETDVEKVEHFADIKIRVGSG